VSLDAPTSPSERDELQALIEEAWHRTRRRRRRLLDIAVAIIVVIGLAVSIGRSGQSLTAARGGGPGPVGAQRWPSGRQFEYVKSEDLLVTGVGSGRWFTRLQVRSVGQVWYKPDGAGRQWTEYEGDPFFAARDRAVYLAHRRAFDASSLVPHGVTDGTLPEGVGLGPIPGGLPTDPQALLRTLELKLYAQQRVVRLRAPRWSEAAFADGLAASLQSILMRSNSLALRAAAYQAIASLPGERVLGWQRDAIGRRGIAIDSAPTYPPGPRKLLAELLIDPATGDVMQTQYVLLEPWRVFASVPPFPAGTVISRTVFLARGFVNRIEDLPGGGHVPYRGMHLT
jgi:hypothetical protein